MRNLLPSLIGMFLCLQFSLQSQDVSVDQQVEITGIGYESVDKMTVGPDQSYTLFSRWEGDHALRFESGFVHTTLNPNGLISGIREQYLLQQIDSSGQLAWSQLIEVKEFSAITSLSMLQSRDNEIYLAVLQGGRILYDENNPAANVNSIGQGNLHLIKYNTKGKFLWAKRFNQSTEIFGNPILRETPDGKLALGVNSGNSFDADPGSPIASTNDGGGINNLVIMLDTAGVFIETVEFSNSTNPFLFDFLFKENGEMVLTFSVFDEIDMVPGPDTLDFPIPNEYRGQSTSGLILNLKAGSFDYKDHQGLFSSNGVISPDISYDPISGQVYLIGSVRQNFQVGFNKEFYQNFNTSNQSQNFILALNQQLNLENLGYLTSTGTGFISGLKAAEEGGLLLLVFTEDSLDLNPDTTLTYYDPAKVSPGLGIIRLDADLKLDWAFVRGNENSLVSLGGINMVGNRIFFFYNYWTSQFSPPIVLDPKLDSARYGSTDPYQGSLIQVWRECEERTLVISNNQGVLNASVSGAQEYRWYYCSNDSLVYAGSRDSIIPSKTGEYRVEISIEGCNYISPCYNLTELIDTSIAVPRFQDDLLVLPNPASEIADVYWNGRDTVQAVIGNLQGEIVQEIRLGPGRNPIILKGPPGLYIIYTEEKTFKYLKL